MRDVFIFIDSQFHRLYSSFELIVFICSAFCAYHQFSCLDNGRNSYLFWHQWLIALKMAFYRYNISLQMFKLYLFKQIEKKCYIIFTLQLQCELASVFGLFKYNYHQIGVRVIDLKCITLIGDFFRFFNLVLWLAYINQIYVFQLFQLNCNPFLHNTI